MEKATKNLISTLKKQKRDKSLLFLDNVKIIKDAIANKSIQVEYILTSMDKLPFSFDENDKVFHTEQKNIDMLADTKTPQKVLCIAYYSQYIVVKPNDNFLVIDELQDPGNVGTLIRTAKACGMSSVFLIDSVSITNSKLIRSSVGAIFNIPVYEFSKSDFINFAVKNKLELINCDMNGENIFTYKPKGSIGIVVGNEGQGVSDEIAKICSKSVKIPMAAGIESLNAGVSGSIIMYEISKNKFI